MPHAEPPASTMAAQAQVNGEAPSSAFLNVSFFLLHSSLVVVSSSLLCHLLSSRPLYAGLPSCLPLLTPPSTSPPTRRLRLHQRLQDQPLWRQVPGPDHSLAAPPATPPALPRPALPVRVAVRPEGRLPGRRHPLVH
jgi:hypothetical protein